MKSHVNKMLIGLLLGSQCHHSAGLEEAHKGHIEITDLEKDHEGNRNVDPLFNDIAQGKGEIDPRKSSTKVIQLKEWVYFLFFHSSDFFSMAYLGVRLNSLL